MVDGNRQMQARLFVGVDGGGSRTRARVRADSGELLGEAEAEAGNARLPQGYEENIRACRLAIAAAGLGEDAMARVYAGFGLAGTQQDTDLKNILDRPHPFASLTVDTDAYAAWLGAFGGGDGAILILGTGSCGLAVIDGQRINVGGWGLDIADDGSGAALGRQAIRRALWALEGMAPLTPFAESVLADFGGEAQNATIWAAEAVPGDFAAYAPRTFDYAERGDELAVAVVTKTAVEATMLITRLRELGAQSVAMIGGLFPRILPCLNDSTRAVMVEPAADAADGAILMARRTLDGIGTGRE